MLFADNISVIAASGIGGINPLNAINEIFGGLIAGRIGCMTLRQIRAAPTVQLLEARYVAK